MKIKNSAGPNAVPCGTTELTCIQDKLNPRWRRFVSNDLNKRENVTMTEKPGFLSYDRKTALSSDVIVIRWQVLIEGAVRFTFPRRDRTSVSRWTSEPREGLVVDRAKVVTLFLSYDKTTLSIGLIPGFEPATHRSYATKLTPPADSAVVKYGFLSARCLFVNFRGSFMVYYGKTTYTFFFRL